MVEQGAKCQYGRVARDEGQALHGVFARKTMPSGTPATDAAVRQNVLAKKGMMPGFAGRFSDEEMTALIAYLHTGLR